MSNFNKNEMIKNACQKLLSLFESGNLPQAVTRTWIEGKIYDKPSNRWSLGNRLLMIGEETFDARGYDQWQQVGRHVKKGAKAFYIFGPNTKKIGKLNKETGEKEESMVLTGFHVIPVFKYEDTEGKDIPEANYTPDTLPALYEVAEKFGVSVQYAPKIDGAAWGYFSPGQNHIVLKTHQEKTFWHELGHVAHSKIRVLKPGQDPDQEIVAETVGVILCQLYGVEGFEPHCYRYIKSYAQTETPEGTVRKMMQLLSDIEKCLNLIFESANESSLNKIVA